MTIIEIDATEKSGFPFQHCVLIEMREGKKIVKPIWLAIIPIESSRKSFSNIQMAVCSI